MHECIYIFCLSKLNIFISSLGMANAHKIWTHHPTPALRETFLLKHRSLANLQNPSQDRSPDSQAHRIGVGVTDRTRRPTTTGTLFASRTSNACWRPSSWGEWLKLPSLCLWTLLPNASHLIHLKTWTSLWFQAFCHGAPVDPASLVGASRFRCACLSDNIPWPGSCHCSYLCLPIATTPLTW